MIFYANSLRNGLIIMGGHHTIMHSTHSRGFTLRILMLFLAWLFLAAHLGVAETISIGEIDPLTGKLAKHGTEIHEGILYAVEEANKAGGIRGNPVELICRDDQSQPEIAINQAEDLLYRAKVIGLVGGYVDSLVGPISELAAKHHVPYVASASLQRTLTLGRENPYFFRVAHLDGITQPLCRFLVDVLQPKRAAIVFAATPGATEFGQEIKDCLEKSGIDVPVFEKFRSGPPDFSALLLKLRSSNVEVLISGGFFPDHLMLVRQIREQRVPLKAYIGPWGIAYPSFIEEMGEAGEGLFGMCAWSPGITLPGTEKESQDFVRGFYERFQKKPNTTTMHGYTSARALLRGIENSLMKGRGLTGDAIREELSALNIVLPMEHLAFDHRGDPKNYQQVVIQIQKKQMVAVYPPDRATGSIMSGHQPH